MDTITLKEVIERMDKGEIFSIAFISFNKRENTGGEWIAFEQAYKSKFQTATSHTNTTSQTTIRKDPKHFDNSTRNLVVLPEGNIVKVHLRLIRRFNSKVVL